MLTPSQISVAIHLQVQSFRSCRKVNVKMKKRMLSLVMILILSAAVDADEEAKNITVLKPFILVNGPFYIGGSDTDEEDNEMSLKIYKAYINYNRLMGKYTQEDEQYYMRYFSYHFGQNWYNLNVLRFLCLIPTLK